MSDPVKGPKWFAELYRCLELDGDIMEVGVFRGYTFRLMLLARNNIQHLPRVAYAVDSWEGMAAPGPHDNQEYPKGKFGHVTSAEFHREMANRGFANLRDYVAVKGFVPQVFKQYEGTLLRFSFVHVDLDQYQPTLDAATWAWQRLVPGGVLAFHDWYPAKHVLAAAAISRFLHEAASAVVRAIPVIIEGDELMLVKPEEVE